MVFSLRHPRAITVIVGLRYRVLAEYAARSISGQRTSARIEVIAICGDAGGEAASDFASGLRPDIPLELVEFTDFNSASTLLRVASESNADIVALHSSNSYWTTERKLDLQTDSLAAANVDYSWHQVLVRESDALHVLPGPRSVSDPRSMTPAWESLVIRSDALGILRERTKDGKWDEISSACRSHLKGVRTPGALAVINQFVFGLPNR